MNSVRFKNRNRRNLLIILAFFSFTYFLTPLPADNVLSRANLTASIVNEKNTDINEYQDNTLDKSFVNGSYYSDKAPGISLAAVPFAYIYSIFKTPDPEDILFVQFITIFAVSIPAMFLILCLYKSILESSENEDIAIITCLSLVFCTLFLPYSSMFYGHVSGASLSFIIFYIIFYIEKTPPLLFLCGVFSVLLTGIEYPLALHSLLFTILVFLKLNNKKQFLFYIAGCIPVVMMLMYYNYTSFGNAFSVGYMHESWEPFKNGMGKGVAGVTIPSFESFFSILLNPGRGLFVISPFLILFIPGVIHGIRDRNTKASAISSLILILLTISINSSQYLPLGGMAPGPRHLIPIIPYMCFLASFSLNIKHVKHYIYPFLIGMSFVFSITFMNIEPHVHEIFDSTLFEFYIPSLKEGVFRVSWISYFFPNLNKLSILFYLFIVITSVMAILRFKNYYLKKYILYMISGVMVFISLQYFYYQIISSEQSIYKKYTLASTWEHLGFKDSAFRKYEEVVKEDPGNFMAQFSLGILNYRKKNYYESEQYFENAIKSNPQFSQAHFNLAQTKVLKRDYENAVKHYLLSIQYDKYNDTQLRASSYASIAMIYYKLGDYPQGVKYIELAKNSASGNIYVKQVEEKFKKFKKDKH